MFKSGFARKIAASLALGALLMTSAVGIAEAKGPGNGKGNTNNVSNPSSIVLDQDAGTLSIGSGVTFTTSVDGLKGGEYPMVYLECSQGGTVVYGQLDHPDVVFVLGGGSSPWLSNPGPATCVAHLFAYGGKSQGYDTIRELAVTPAFDVH